MLRELLTALARPLVLVRTEVTGEHGPMTHGLVVGHDAVCSHDAWPGEEESEYVPIEPQTMVWEMARKVKLRRVILDETEISEISKISEVKTTMGALDGVLTVLGQNSGDVAAARSAALSSLSATGGIGEPELLTLVELAPVHRLDMAYHHYVGRCAGRPVGT